MNAAFDRAFSERYAVPANVLGGRREAREARRRERVAQATTPKATLEAAWDYLRGVIAEIEKSDLPAADRVRVQAANELMRVGQQVQR